MIWRSINKGWFHADGLHETIANVKPQESLMQLTSAGNVNFIETLESVEMSLANDNVGLNFKDVSATYPNNDKALLTQAGEVRGVISQRWIATRPESLTSFASFLLTNITSTTMSLAPRVRMLFRSSPAKPTSQRLDQWLCTTAHWIDKHEPASSFRHDANMMTDCARDHRFRAAKNIQ